MRLLRHELRDLRRLPRRLDELETLFLEDADARHDRAQAPWRAALPNTDLTWGRAVPGDAFVAKAQEHGAFGEGKTILEVGPGYGRLLDAAVQRRAPFARWVGVDLSEPNVAHLRRRFPEERFIHADAGTVDLDAPVDALLSSLTLKHVHPSFEPLLRHLAGSLRPDGVVVVDLIEGHRRYFHGGTTYIRWYTREEVAEIFGRSGLTVDFDEVEHDPDHRRLLAVGRPG
jgi:SAM-dependent methyltransferase